MLNPDPHRAIGAGPSSAALAGGPLALALIMLAVAAATILGALGFEHIGGHQPCALCLMQRTPYYLGVPVAAAAAMAAWLGAPRLVVATLFAAFALLMLYGGGVAVYHSGVEWGLWEGPADCADAPGARSAADMLDGLGEGQILLADRAYDSDHARAELAARGAWANIKPMPNRKNVPAFSAFLYRRRNLVERFFNKLKHFRAVATRYETHAANYLALVKLAAVRIWIPTMPKTGRAL